MLMPKRVKYRKQQRGRMRGKAYRGGAVTFGEYGLQALEPAGDAVVARLGGEGADALVRIAGDGSVEPLVTR